MLQGQVPTCELTLRGKIFFTNATLGRPSLGSLDFLIQVSCFVTHTHTQHTLYYFTKEAICSTSHEFCVWHPHIFTEAGCIFNCQLFENYVNAPLFSWRSNNGRYQALRSTTKGSSSSINIINTIISFLFRCQSKRAPLSM